MSDVRRDIIINRLVEMGFGKEDAKVALSKKEFRGVEDAMDWLISQQGKCPITWFFSIWCNLHQRLTGSMELLAPAL